MASVRAENVYMAQLAEHAERFDEMVDYMKRAVEGSDAELTVDERNLLSVAYKNAVSTRRHAWRTVFTLEKKELQASSPILGKIREYRETIEKELGKLCNDILIALSDSLIPKCTTPDAKVFYLKMKGDYYRYLSEASTDCKDIASKGLEAYSEADKIAEAALEATDPIRLGLALNFSVFYYEVMGSPEKAIELARTTIEQSHPELEQLSAEEYRDSATILQLLKDNLTLWTEPAPLEDTGGDQDREETSGDDTSGAGE